MTMILGVSCSMREGAHTTVLVRTALEAATQCGAETHLLELRLHPLPIYEAHRNYDSDERVQEMLRVVEKADGYIVGSPEYHGCMSGAAKNFFDYLYREIAGKLFGLIAATGGSQGVSCLDNMRAAVLYCHGWVLPYNTAASTSDFDEQGNLISEKVIDRLQRIGRDITIYAPLLYQQFQADLQQEKPPMPGFAQWVG